METDIKALLTLMVLVLEDFCKYRLDNLMKQLPLKFLTALFDPFFTFIYLFL